MLLVNYASATTLPETVPAFTAFMNMKNERPYYSVHESSILTLARNMVNNFFVK